MDTSKGSDLVQKLAPNTIAKANLFLDALILTIASAHVGTSSYHDLLSVAFLMPLSASVTAWVFSAYALHHYHDDKSTGFAADLMLTAAILGGLALVWTVSGFISASRAPFELAYRFLSVVLPAVGITRLAVLTVRKAAEAPATHTLIIGTETAALETNDMLAARKNVKLIGHIAFDAQSAADTTVLGTIQELPEVITSNAIGKVYVASEDATPQADVARIAEVCETFGVAFALRSNRARIRLSHSRRVVDGAPVAGYVDFHMFEPKPLEMMIKRLIDIIASSVALALLSPLLIVVAIAVKVTSKGPVLFKQERVGLHGRHFHMLKFRSMVINAEEIKAKLMKLNEQTGPVFKMTRDPRVTSIGRFIRKFSIDELPQLINILRGEMTIVGPRPAVPPEVAQYKPWQRKRLSVLPGLTCTWQVSGRNQIPFEQWMKMDIEYIRHWSLRNDIGLILKTVPVVLTGRGAS